MVRSKVFESVKNSDNSKIQKIGPKYVGTQIVPIIYKIAMKVLKCMLNTFLASLKKCICKFLTKSSPGCGSSFNYKEYENYDIALAMSFSRADPVLGHCPGWGYLNI